MISAIIALALLAAFFGLVLGFSAIIFKVEASPVVEQIDKLLPQTQCAQCTYAGCRPYAEAIAEGEAEINMCPPGGQQTIQAIADLLDVEALPLAGGEEAQEEPGPILAIIDEQTCIGCTLCIQACPVDAILGAAKQMHTVIAAECTGCELCVEPCPVDCIDMVGVEENIKTWKWPKPVNHINHPLPLGNFELISEKTAGSF